MTILDDHADETLRRWIVELPAFRDYRSRLHHDTALTMAYVGLYDRDPKQMNGLITGGCFWPPEVSLHDLLTDCRQLIGDLRELADLGLMPASTTLRCRLWAAHRVLSDMMAPEVPDRDDYPEGTDVYRCAECGAEQAHDLPNCPRETIRDCDVLCETSNPEKDKRS